LFVGSSSSSRFFRPATSWASASFVFLPPEGAGILERIRPLRPNIPSKRKRNAWSSARDSARMWVSTSTPS
jgi:hypothetical protein